jgi:flagellar biosynthetic protein FlhB
MATETDLDRSEAATPHKLSEARKHGQVAKSPDAVAALVFAAAVTYLYAEGWNAVRAQFRFDQQLFVQAATLVASPANLWHLIGLALRETLSLLLPFLATLVVAAVLGNLAQTGVLFSLHPIKPQWERVDPIKGFKRLFSGRTLFETLRACAKLVVLAWVVYASLTALLPQFYRLAGLAPLGQAQSLLADVAALGFKIAVALFFIAALDLAYTRREFARRQRMSKRELKDEFKHREGDPRIRARLRELRREVLKRSLALRRTRDADLVVTNPTHFAVALRYRHGEMSAPKLVSKGAGAMAAAIRTIAARHRIPVIENRTLARALYAETGLDQDVPSALYPEIARLMVWVFAMRQARASAARGAVA